MDNKSCYFYYPEKYRKKRVPIVKQKDPFEIKFWTLEKLGEDPFAENDKWIKDTHWKGDDLDKKF